jgi:hypothetical protein
LAQDPDPDDPTDYALPPQNKEEEEQKAKLMPEMETVSYLNVAHVILTYRVSENKIIPWSPKQSFGDER